MGTKTFEIPAPNSAPAAATVVVIALVGSSVVVLGALAPLTLAAIVALAVFVLAAAGNESVLLAMVFLTPLGWVIGKSESIVSAFPARSNIDAALLARCFILFGYFFGRLTRGRIDWRRLLKPSMTKASLVFAGAILLSAILAEPDMRSISIIRATMRLAAYLGTFFFILDWCTTSQRIQKVVLLLLVSTFLVAGFGILQMIVGGYTPLWHLLFPPDADLFAWNSRATSVFDSPNDLAIYLNLVIPLAAAWVAWGEERGKRIAYAALGFSLIALLCSQSRGGMLGLACAGAVAILCYAKKGRARTISMVMFVSLGITIALVAMGGADDSHLAGGDLSTGTTRLLLWGVAWKLFLASPIHGVGWANFQMLYQPFIDPSLISETELGVHSSFIGLLVETGFLGLFAYCTLLITGMRRARRLFRASQKSMDRIVAFSAMGGIAAMMGQGILEYQIALTQFGVLFWMILALLEIRLDNLTQENLVGSRPLFNDGQPISLCRK